MILISRSQLKLDEVTKELEDDFPNVNHKLFTKVY